MAPTTTIETVTITRPLKVGHKYIFYCVFNNIFRNKSYSRRHVNVTPLSYVIISYDMRKNIDLFVIQIDENTWFFSVLNF